MQIIGSWTAGTTHADPTGTDRALIFIAYAESEVDTSDLGSVTYGGQEMTKVVEKNMHVGWSTYTCAFILSEAGIASATSDDFVVTWNTSPSGTPAYSSVFLSGVDQSSMVGQTSTGGSTTTTAETSPLSNNDGDMAFVAGTCNADDDYSTINNFIESIEVTPQSADGIAGYLPCTGTDVTPGVSHPSVNRQSVIGFIIQAAAGASPACDINGDGQVDHEDLELLGQSWLWSGEPGAVPEDIKEDGHIDLYDFAELANQWLK